MRVFVKKKKFFLLSIPILLGLIIGVQSGSDKESGEKNSYLEDKAPFKVECVNTFGVEEAKSKEEIPYEFATIYSVDCDAAGNIYVLDGKQDCVKKFTKDGKFLSEFFRRGKGPNEISHAYKLLIDSDRMLLLHEYGYEIKAFDLDGKFLKSYYLPEQFLNHADLWDTDNGKKLVFSALGRNSKRNYKNFKVLNLEELKIEDEFAPTNTPDTLNIQQRFAIEETSAVLWTANTEQVKLMAYNLKDGKEKPKQVEIPGKLKRNKVIHFTKDGLRTIRAVYYNLAQPFLLKSELFFILTENRLEAETPEAVIDPRSCTLTLYHVTNNKPEKVEELAGCDHMRVGAAYENRVILYGTNPYPRLKILEIEKMESAARGRLAQHRDKKESGDAIGLNVSRGLK